MSGRVHVRLFVPALAALAALALAATAQADYEQVGTFAQSGNGEQLWGPQFDDIAVNTTGAGGVEAGSVYVSSPERISRYSPTGEIKEVWGWGVIASGPDLHPGGFERCRPANGDICTPQKGSAGTPHDEGVGYFSGTTGVTLDQSTGNVYVRNQIVPTNNYREHNLIEVFSADGSESIARFGDAGAEGETIEEGPEKIHSSSGVAQGIAVDAGGRVYLTDNQGNSGTARLMCFRPESPGDYEHYVYCGRSEDVNLSDVFQEVALDDTGHLYASTSQFIGEYSQAEPSAPPLCTFNIPGQGRGMTVNPATGEVFFYNSSGSDRKLHRLAPCDPEAARFEEMQTPIALSPVASGKGLTGLAFNPSLTWGPQRPAGVIYGASPATITAEGAEYKGLGYIFAPAEVHPPTIESESVSNTRTTSTVVHAEIDPHGYGTRYIFQYESEASYESSDPEERFAGAMEAPLGGGEIGAGEVGQASAALTGLSPDTAYVFRVVASSECEGEGEGAESCLGEGEALTFATYPPYPPGLPDHRAYELVSPAQKHGGEVIPAQPAITSCSTACKPSTFGLGVFPMQSARDGEALAYVGQPFNLAEGAVNYDSYVARRTAGGWQSTALIPALPPSGVKQLAFDSSLERGLLDFEVGEPNLEIQNTSNPSSTTPLVGETNYRSAGNLRLTYGGHSPDFTRQYFAANDSLSEATPFAPEPPDPGTAKKDLYEWHNGQLTLINVLPGNEAVATGAKFASLSPDTHAVSEDGYRVFFEYEGDLYAREGGEVTRLINDPGHFLSAAPDGSEVLLDDGCLYAVETGTCTDLTEGQGGFKGLVGQSRDLSRIYFVDTEALGGGEANKAGEVAEAGKNNLYSWSGGQARFVAILLTSDGSSSYGASNDWAASPAARQAEASPNGRFLAFASTASLTGYDNLGPCLKEGGGIVSAPCPEAFLYDSATGKLTCASCNPTGEAPLGPSTLRRIGQPTPVEEFPQPRYLTDEGRLYFDTQDSLVARDTNEGVEDVYEYSPQGAGVEGTCEREAGCTRLISAGTEPVDSNLIAVDETGKNVFFDTRDKLALKDKDELLDIYDAREGGGIGAETEVARAECQGEACQAPVYAPNDPTPGSSTFEGAGNVKEPTAAKKHKHAKKKHKRHSKKKHSKKHKKAKSKVRTAKRNHGGAK